MLFSFVFNYCGIFGKQSETVIGAMNTSMHRRGPDQNGLYRNGLLTLGHNRLSVIDPEHGRQPMTVTYRGREYTIVYNGEIYNKDELNRRLQSEGITVQTQSDTETVLWTYVKWGTDCPTS